MKSEQNICAQVYWLILLSKYRISSGHNSAIVRKIEEAIGETIYSPVQIQSWWPMFYVSFFTFYIAEGCKTYYKKSIAAREKETSPVRKQKLIRSLKQRVREHFLLSLQ